jgi:hypothetical protein
VYGRHKYYVPAAQRRSPPPSEGSERANALVLRVGIFQYNNILVPTGRRVARMRRHLTSIHITYRYRELYVIYMKSAECRPNHVQFRRLDASQQLPCTAGSRKAVTCIFRNCARSTSCTHRNSTYTFSTC